MSQSSLPPDALELRGEEERGGRTHRPFLGGIVAGGLLLRMPNSGELYFLSWGKALGMSAQVADCSVEDVIEFAKREASEQQPNSGPGGPVNTGACHGRPRRTA